MTRPLLASSFVALLIVFLTWLVSLLTLDSPSGTDVVTPPVKLLPGHTGLACAKCHGESAFDGLIRNFVDPARGIRSMNARCSSCHPRHDEHHPHANGGLDCLKCHVKEHRGRAAFLRVPDSTCAECHGKPLLRKDGSPSALLPVGRSAVHSEVEALRRGVTSDPSEIDFPHDVHLAEAGIPDSAGRRERLGCGSCHTPAGRGHRPVRYEAHCARCHKLSLTLPLGPAPAELQARAALFHKEPAPHRPAKEVYEVTSGRLLELRKDFPDLRAFWLPKRSASPQAAESHDDARWLGQAAQAVTAPLFNSERGCRLCHHVGRPAAGGAPFPEVMPTGVPARWHRRAVFDHRPHRSTDCSSCHGQALTSKSAKDILLPGISSCWRCHGSQAQPAAAPRASAPDRCVTCHPFHGVGARRLD